MIYAIIGETRDYARVLDALHDDLEHTVYEYSPDEAVRKLPQLAIDADFVSLSHEQFKAAVETNPGVSFHSIIVIGASRANQDAAKNLEKWLASDRPDGTTRVNAHIGTTVDAPDDEEEALDIALQLEEHRRLYEKTKAVFADLVATPFYTRCDVHPGMYHTRLSTHKGTAPTERLVTADVLADVIVPDDNAFATVMRMWLALPEDEDDDEDELDD